MRVSVLRHPKSDSVFVGKRTHICIRNVLGGGAMVHIILPSMYRVQIYSKGILRGKDSAQDTSDSLPVFH